MRQQTGNKFIGGVALVLGTIADRFYMPGADLASYDAMFKEDYAPAMINQLAEENETTDFMQEEMADDTWQGREKVQPIKLGRNWSAGSIGAGGALPQQGRATYKDFIIGMRDTYGAVGFERYTIEQSGSKKGAFEQVIPMEMDGLVEDIAFVRNRMAWGYGSGILALVNGAVSVGGVTVTVDAPGNVAGTVMGNRYLNGDTNSGMFISFINASTGVIEHSSFITGVSAGGTQITLETAAPSGISDNAQIVIAQTPARNSASKEPEGILAGIDDGTYVSTYHGLSRTTFPQLKSYVTTGVGALSLDAMQQNLDALSIRGSWSIDMFMCEHAVRRSYLALLEADRRYTGADLSKPDGGTKAAKKPKGKAITFGDIPIMAHRDAPYRMLFGVNKESWIRYVLSEGKWADEEGHVMKWVSGFDQYLAFWYILDNFHCQAPNRNFRMEGIDVNQIAVHTF